MTDELDFTEFETDSDDSGTTSKESSSNRGFHQVHIKGRWGTTTYTDETPCFVCGCKPDAILLAGVSPSADHDSHGEVRHICDSHEEDVRENLEYQGEQIKRVDF